MESKRRKKTYYVDSNLKEAGVATVISEKTLCKGGNITRDKEASLKNLQLTWYLVGKG